MTRQVLPVTATARGDGDTTTRLLLVDDQQLIREGLRGVLHCDDELVVVDECADGSEVGAAVSRSRPDVVLMDIRMRSVDGDIACRLLLERPNPPPVIAVTAYDNEDVIRTAMAAGVRGVVLKNSPGEDLIAAVKAVARGAAWIDRHIADQVLKSYRTALPASADSSPPIDVLTDREIEVLIAASRGATNAEIAAELLIGEATVKTHLAHVLNKLGLRDRLALVVYAFDHQLTREQLR